MSTPAAPEALVRTFLSGVEPRASELPDPYGDAFASFGLSPTVSLRGHLSRLAEGERELVRGFQRERGTATQDFITRGAYGSTGYDGRVRGLYRQEEADRSALRERWVGGLPGEDRETLDALCLAGDESVDPADLFRRLCERVAYFLDFPPETAPGTAATIVLWVVLTYAYPAWDALPYLYVGGPMGSGKSRLLEVLSRLAFRPLVSANLTAPALFRTLHARGGTMLYDEAERLRQHTPEAQEVNAVFLSGYKRGTPATRLEPVGDSFRTVQFDVYGPKAIACIAGVPPTLASRCVPVVMFRAGADSEKPKRRLGAEPDVWAKLRDDLHVLALEHGPTWVELAGRQGVVPPAINGRDFELWQPLLALAEWFESRGAGRLLELVRRHALASVEGAREDAVPEADEALLDALAEEVREGRHPSPGELLRTVQDRDPVTFRMWFPTSVTRRLKNYGIPAPKKSNGGKRFRHVTPDMLIKIQRHYGIDLGFADPAAPSPIEHP